MRFDFTGTEFSHDYNANLSKAVALNYSVQTDISKSFNQDRP